MNINCITSCKEDLRGKEKSRYLIRRSTFSKVQCSSLLSQLYQMLRKDPLYQPALSLLRLEFNGNKQQLQFHVTQPVKQVHSLEKSRI